MNSRLCSSHYIQYRPNISGLGHGDSKAIVVEGKPGVVSSSNLNMLVHASKSSMIFLTLAENPNIKLLFQKDSISIYILILLGHEWLSNHTLASYLLIGDFNPYITDTITVSKDEFPRAGCTIESLQKLRPCFITDGSGTVTAGSSSGQYVEEVLAN